MDKVNELLKSLIGYDVDDNTLLEFIFNSEKQHILNNCNLDELPSALEYVVIERTAGRYLELKIKDVLSDEDLTVVKSIKEGDTEVQFGDVSAEVRLHRIIDSLLRDRGRDMACYRKFKW